MKQGDSIYQYDGWHIRVNWLSLPKYSIQTPTQLYMSHCTFRVNDPEEINHSFTYLEEDNRHTCTGIVAWCPERQMNVRCRAEPPEKLLQMFNLLCLSGGFEGVWSKNPTYGKML